jgi:hypothetical protein
VKVNLKRYGLYLLRWQLSTPILAVTLALLASLGKLYATIAANFIGGLIFFWVDNFIFRSRRLEAQWEVREKIICCDCHKAARGYRLVRTRNYDKSDAAPQFRCEACSQKKTEELRLEGVVI